MRYMHVHFHHVPGEEHDHSHHHHHGHDGDHCHEPAYTKEQAIQLLEYLRGHNAEHATELAGYRDNLAGEEAAGLLTESVELLEQSNAKLAEAIACLKGGE